MVEPGGSGRRFSPSESKTSIAKNGDTRTVPLNSLLREALEKIMAENPGEYVFARRRGEPYQSIRTIFATACRRAGLAGVTPHTLRHTFASRLAMDGVDLRTIQELGGWSKLEMVQRYAHLSPSHKAEAVERIARRDFPTGITTPDTMPLAAQRVSSVG
jgi:integrase